MEISYVLRPLGLLTLAALLFGCGSQPNFIASAPDMVINNVTVVDAISGAREDQRVLVAGGKIVAVQSTTEPLVAAPSVIDGTGLYLIPGLWDMHVHFLYDLRLTQAMPDLFLDYGITSVRDTGGEIDELAALRTAWRAGAAPVPRIMISGPLLDGSHVVYDGGDAGRPPLGTDVGTVSAAVTRVAEMKSKGADFIKIYELVSPEVFDQLVLEAARHDLPIASHVPLSLTADVAGPKVGTMEHLRNVELACASNWQALLEERRETIANWQGRGFDLRSQLHAAQRIPAIQSFDPLRCDEVLASLTNTIQVPTLRLNTMSVVRPFERTEWREGLKRLPADVSAAWEDGTRRMPEDVDATFTDWSFSLVGRMYAAGVPIGAGTDTPIGFGIPGESLHAELALLVRSGLSPREALYAATVRPAEFFGTTQSTGQIAPGMNADLVLLQANPLTEIANTRGIVGVMVDGRWARPPKGK